MAATARAALIVPPVGVRGSVFADVPGQRLGRRERNVVGPSQEAVGKLLRARERGFSLHIAARLAGVHVATVCRWQNRDPALHQALQAAALQARRRRALNASPRPQVAWHSQCPLCKAKVVVRTAGGGLRFWRCGRWPWCRWASWRPWAPRNCRRCGGPRYWSHSRKSVVCGACGVRIMAH